MDLNTLSLKDLKDLQDKVAIAIFDFEKRKKRRDGRVVKYQGRKDKAFKGEAISAEKTYSSWLKSQPTWFVQDSLGKERANLFLNKGYSLSSFSDMTGRPLTLDEIVKREG